MAMREVYINDSNCITPLGFDVQANFDALLEGKSGIVKSTDFHKAVYVSKIDEQLLNKSFAEIGDPSAYTKLEKMLILTLKPLVSEYSISKDTPLIVSTTKGNIDELHHTNPRRILLHEVAQAVTDFFGLTQQAIVISNACVSGLLSVAVAKRMIQAGVYEGALVVAGDIISEFVLSGFHSFQAISDTPCRPYDESRKGITLGEAAAAVYISTVKSKNPTQAVKISGDGAINDANHISGPSRTGEGLYKSILAALEEAAVDVTAVDFISAHGTATHYNDEMEAIAFNRASLEHVPLNSLKGYYGHTLGASGLLETIISIESAFRNVLIPSVGYETSGISQPLNIIKNNQQKDIKYFLKTASGFGGCNTAVLFEKIA
ncbi:beta-ketoacyl synthase N-terminal-like domain-containing protein [Planktosalinus lacus]|uniref:Beta-ketoacyl synthase n=1 Tax=Planktosalinus lacus TaxID=1526573 RepID=A0A8J2V7T5_9FLAO|nr:beta-ketoacyl synthase N-terminal-like domain-containing protein [Planktosalinus lacus]GGD80860.1 beta-ketoacyl synthase [Planktosalinus lacus]